MGYRPEYLKTVKINIRCTPHERERFRKAAEKEGITVSAALRRLMLDYSEGEIVYRPNQKGLKPC